MFTDSTIELVADVQVVGVDNGRIRQSAGTQTAPGGEPIEPYETGARIPREPWGRNTLVTTTPTPSVQADPGNTLQVMRIGEFNLEGIGALQEAIRKSYPLAAVARIANSPAVNEDLCSIDRALQERMGWQSVKSLGIACKLPGLKTITTEWRTGRRAGLHVDSWYGPQLGDRGRRPTRLCINVGIEPRHFLFIGITVERMALLRGLGDPATLMANDVVSSFLHDFPDFPVTCVTVNPGEAYLAPTENIVHDSTSIGRSTIDVALTYLGHLSARPGGTSKLLPSAPATIS